MSAVLRSRALWFSFAVATAFAAAAFSPGADPASMRLGIPEVAAAGAPNPLYFSARETPALASIKAVAVTGTPNAGGPSANQGQIIQLKGAALSSGVATFPGYNGTAVTAPLTDIKPGKKGRAAVPPLAITGDVAVVPDGGSASTGLKLQIVPTVTSPTKTTVTPGTDLTINGTGFDPNTKIVFPGVATPVTPSQLDNDSAVVTVPATVQKGALKVTTPGGTSNFVKLKIAAAKVLANRALDTDPETGLILATDDVRNTLDAIDPQTGAVIRSVRVLDEPSWVRVDQAARVAVVRDRDGNTTRIDLATWTEIQPDSADARSAATVVERAPVDTNRHVVSVVTPSGERVSIRIDDEVESAVSTADGRLAVVVAGDSGRLYVVDLATREVVRVHRFDGPVEGVTIGVDGRAYTADRATGRLLSVPVE